jgi:hypothetical protein
MMLQETVFLYSHSGHLIYPLFSCSAITGYKSSCEGTVFHITEFVNAFGFVMMEWHSEAEQALLQNNMHILLSFRAA